jgi:enoyl-CoA hydratase
LRRDALERTSRYADEDPAVTGLWSRRSADGWTARYLESVTRG